MLIRTQDLALGYGRKCVLRGVNLEVQSGDFFFVVGPNGSGKSTLLRSFLGLIEPMNGELILGDTYRSGARTGFVPQRSEFNLSLPTTVGEFVGLGLAGQRMQRAEERERKAFALNQVALDGHEDRDYRSLSGGQRQRALVARALVRKPSLLVLDEPTNGLDMHGQVRLLDALSRWRDEFAGTAIFVTHDLRIARSYATRVAFVCEGTVTVGAASELLTPKRIEDVYGSEVLPLI